MGNHNSSNAFAILGLRSLYLVMAHTIAELRDLHYGLAGGLAFAALKLIGARSLHVSPPVSLAVVAAMLGAAVLASLGAARKAACP